jgi:hypothetical protein
VDGLENPYSQSSGTPHPGSSFLRPHGAPGMVWAYHSAPNTIFAQQYLCSFYASNHPAHVASLSRPPVHRPYGGECGLPLSRVGYSIGYHIHINTQGWGRGDGIVVVVMGVLR